MSKYIFKDFIIIKVEPKHEKLISDRVLTEIDLLVLAEMLKGLTHAQIAKNLNKSKRTINAQVLTIRDKMQCTSITETLLKAISNGLFMIKPINRYTD